MQLEDDSKLLEGQSLCAVLSIRERCEIDERQIQIEKEDRNRDVGNSANLKNEMNSNWNLSDR